FKVFQKPLEKSRHGGFRRHSSRTVFCNQRLDSPKDARTPNYVGEKLMVESNGVVRVGMSCGADLQSLPQVRFLRYPLANRDGPPWLRRLQFVSPLLHPDYRRPN